MKRQQTDGNLTRQSNIELLRIFAMLLIVAHHFSVHGQFEFSTDAVTVNRLWIQFLQLGGKVGVDIFVLISGYFLVEKRVFKTDKAIRLWLQIFTYSMVIFFVFVGFGVVPFGVKALRDHLLPVIYGQWWFGSTYFMLYLISPYLNCLLNILDKKSYQQMLILTTVCFCLVPTFLRRPFQSSPLIWFVYLYVLAGYLRLYPIEWLKNRASRYIILSVVAYVLTFLSALCFDFAGIKVSFFSERTTMFYAMEQLPVLLISLFAFIGFSNLKMNYHSWVNIVSSATFGVYLIHDNDYMRAFLWQTVFKNASYADSAWLIPYSLLVIAAVFIGCTVIELCRKYIIEKHYLKAINALSVRWDTDLNRLLQKYVFDRL